MAVAEPTSMTWLGLAAAVDAAGGEFVLIGAQHSAPLRGAIMGENTSDVIDADVLSRAPQVFDLRPFRALSPGELALRTAVNRRGAAVLDANRTHRRLLSLARWAFPDVWNAFRGSLPTAPAVLRRWPDLRALAASKRPALTAVVAEHTRARPTPNTGSRPTARPPGTGLHSGTPARSGPAGPPCAGRTVGTGGWSAPTVEYAHSVRGR